ncbi:MAG: peptidase M22, partial [Clostridiales bacterium]|nr:peptidase M22 [Clostridiales bacterium]
ILEVGDGERGLRQSDALFLHTKNIPELFEQLGKENIDAVAYSARPRDVVGSYMPCFLAGEATARAIAALHGVPVFAFSHQAGHIEAAARTCGEKLKDKFLSFHLSGGTTELLLCQRNAEHGYACGIEGRTLDISAGQLIDRIGVLLGLKFPCGAELEKLAAACDEKISVNVCVFGGNCNMSGAENKISKLISDGFSKEYVAKYTLTFVGKTVLSMCEDARKNHPDETILFAGGVMRNEYIRQMLTLRLDNICFAKTELSSDNAVGTAYLGYAKLKGEI